MTLYCWTGSFEYIVTNTRMNGNKNNENEALLPVLAWSRRSLYVLLCGSSEGGKKLVSGSEWRAACLAWIFLSAMSSKDTKLCTRGRYLLFCRHIPSDCCARMHCCTFHSLLLLLRVSERLGEYWMGSV